VTATPVGLQETDWSLKHTSLSSFKQSSHSCFTWLHAESWPECTCGSLAKAWLATWDQSLLHSSLGEDYNHSACDRVRDVKQNPENRISVLETKSGSTPLANKIRIYLFSFSSRKVHNIYQMLGEIQLFKHSFNIDCLQNFSSNGQIWPKKKSNITRFNPFSM